MFKVCLDMVSFTGNSRTSPPICFVLLVSLLVSLQTQGKGIPRKQTATEPHGPLRGPRKCADPGEADELCCARWTRLLDAAVAGAAGARGSSACGRYLCGIDTIWTKT